jgi:hypothetical protein
MKRKYQKRNGGRRTPNGYLNSANRSTHMAWENMKQRCLNENHRQYKDYGGRGISICNRWLYFPDFVSDLGLCPTGLTLERIDNEGNYEPGNIKWATQEEQNSNCRPMYEDGPLPASITRRPHPWAVVLGRRGGSKKTDKPKGFAAMSAEDVKRVQQLALEARRAKKKDLTVTAS